MTDHDSIDGSAASRLRAAEACSNEKRKLLPGQLETP